MPGRDDSAGRGADDHGVFDFNDISKWDHRTGHFPLTDSALRQMSFPSYPSPRPRYYYAAALILYMRTSRTAMEDEVFQKIKQLWEEEWFSEALCYEVLAKGPPSKGALAYTDAEANWCKVRMQELDKAITDASHRERLGLPTKGGKRRAANVEKEKMDLLEVTKQSSNHQREDAGSGGRPAIPRRSAPKDDDSLEVTAPQKRRRTGKGQRDGHTPRAIKSHGACAEEGVPKSDEEGGIPTESAKSTPARGAAKRNKDGVLVSAVDGRRLASLNSLRKMYPSNYRCGSNIRTWNGQKLDLGQAFKVAAWTHYGPRLPTEKSGTSKHARLCFARQHITRCRWMAPTRPSA